MTGEDVPQPVLQILGIKKINTNSDQERYRLLMSDGKYYNSYAMLASQLNEMQHKGLLTENTIVRLDKYMTSMVGKDGAGKYVFKEIYNRTEINALLLIDESSLSPN